MSSAPAAVSRSNPDVASSMESRPVMIRSTGSRPVEICEAIRGQSFTP